MKKIFLCLSLLLLVSACTSYNGTYAAISNKPLNLYNLTGRKSLMAQNVEKTSSRHIGIIIPTSDQPTVEEAVGELLDDYGGDYIAHATITHTAFHIMWAYHYSAWKVRGDVIRVY